MTVEPVSNLKEFTEAKGKTKYAVFDFWATWCGPCRMISPIFEKLAESIGKDKADKIKFYKVDVDAAPDIAQEVGITAMPTFILFKDGNKIDTLLGANPAKLNELIKKAENDE